jgi:hypothetical protein
MVWIPGTHKPGKSSHDNEFKPKRVAQIAYLASLFDATDGVRQSTARKNTRTRNGIAVKDRRDPG